MKKDLHPGIILVVAVVAVVGLGLWLFKASQPAPYQASPGVGGTPAATAPNQIKGYGHTALGQTDAGEVPPKGIPGAPGGK